MRILRSLLLMCAVAAAQVKHPAGIDVTGPLDAPAATRLRLKQAASDPATCVAAPTEFYWNTATNRLRYCSATNVWSDVPAGGSGDVVGPGSAASGNVATFNGTTGKLIQDGGKALPSGSIVGTSDTQTLTAKTLTTPIITSYTVAGLPAATTAGQEVTVTDGRFKGDCTVGGGSSLTKCRASGSAWVPINGPIYQSVSTIFGSSLAASSGDLWAGVSNTATGTSQASRQWMMGPAHTITKLCVRTTSAQPSLGSLVITVQAGDTFNGLTDTATVLTIAANAAAGLHCTTTQSDVAADQWMVLKVRNNDSGSVSAVMERPVITVAYK